MTEVYVMMFVSIYWTTDNRDISFLTCMAVVLRLCLKCLYAVRLCVKNLRNCKMATLNLLQVLCCVKKAKLTLVYNNCRLHVSFDADV